MGRERQKQKNEEIRRAILDTALKIGLDEGFELLSIRKITNALGYSAGSVYHYFKDKQEIVDTIHEEANLIIKDRIKEVLQVDKGFEYNTRVIFSMILELAINEPEKYNLIVLDKYSKRREKITPWISVMEQTIQVGIKKGELRELNPAMAAFNIWSSFIGLMIMLSSKEGITMEEAKHLFDQHMDIIMTGISG